ncbi:MAG: OsmC family protein [Anaerolineales bacterium]|nr:OsmC family protein [Anaerolineales bacterium]
MGKEIKTAVVTWKGTELDFHAELGSGYAFDTTARAGAEMGGGPMEFLLAGVAGCTAIDVVSTLRKMRQPLTGLRVEISGERAPDYPMVYTHVTITYVIQGADVEAKAVERAISLSKETYCSASVMFERAGATMETSYRIES